MLVSGASHSLMTPRARPDPPGSQGVAARPAAVPVADSGGAAGGGSSLSDAVAMQLENDVDYQILRRCFALDESVDSVREGGGAVASRQSTDQTLESNVDLASVGASLTLSRVETTRLEISIDLSDAAIMTRVGRDQRQSVQLDVRFDAQPVQTADPLVLDLSGEGITTTGIERGVSFDLTGDGAAEQVSFVTGNSWFLALDRDANGRIDSGRELFGDQHGAANGFAELSRFDANTDGVIDANDPVFKDLRLMQMGTDGQQVLKSLDEEKISAIGLGYQNTQKALNLYDSVAQIGHYRRVDGSTGEAADVLLGYRGTGYRETA